MPAKFRRRNSPIPFPFYHMPRFLSGIFLTQNYESGLGIIVTCPDSYLDVYSNILTATDSTLRCDQFTPFVLGYIGDEKLSNYTGIISEANIIRIPINQPAS